MRKLLRALVVAAIAAVVLAVGTRAELRAEIQADPRPEAVAALAEQPTEPSQRQALVARVVKPFGATVRAVPSQDAAIVLSTRCGDLWPVLTVSGGWVKVRTEHGVGWIGGSRVVVSTSPAAVECESARFIAPGSYVSASLPTGCLSLRSRPSDEAPVLSCVTSGHVYAILDGPFDPGTGGDWFRVSSQSTGTGWALAEHLYPV